MEGIIIGAGIGGLTTAIALLQKGIAVRVYEAADQFREVGAGIWLAANALQVLKKLGLDEQVMSCGTRLRQVNLVDQEERSIQTLFMPTFEKKYEFGTLALHRAQLHALLRQQLPESAVVLNKRCLSYREKGQKVEVFFADGTSVRGDFLIGADGIKSVIRDQLMGPIPLRYSNQTCWRGTLPNRLPEQYQEASTEIWGNEPGLRVGFSEIGPEQSYFYGTCLAPAGEKDEKGHIKQQLLQIYAHFPIVVKELISEMNENQFIRTDLFDFKPISYWVKGRIALLGDAAHATTPNLGQGGCQAIEDAFVIAQCLIQNDPSNAFLNYQQMRMRKATKIVNMSWYFAKLTNMKRGISLRNSILRHIPQSLIDWQMEKIYRLS